ncbi:MAG TPA: hypothetical protein VNG53_08240 [Bacteroidia bacterium]|nr:hypothetical protein [Bacteroidia bacterium]
MENHGQSEVNEHCIDNLTVSDGAGVFAIIYAILAMTFIASLFIFG